MRFLLLPLMMLSSTTAFVAPVAPARPHHVVRAEPEKAVAKKKGIPLALLIWPLIAVGDDVNNSADKSRAPAPSTRERERERNHAPVDHRPQIYVSQVQPRLAEQGIETPALPYSNTNYLKK